MPQPSTLHLSATLQRKDPRLPVFVVIPHGAVAGWKLTGTTIVDATVNGQALGRRSMKRWDASEAANWFIELTATLCERAGVAVGDALSLSLTLADTAPPVELEALLSQSPALRDAWGRVSESARRMGMEHVRSAKSEAARARRAAALLEPLLVAAKPVTSKSARGTTQGETSATLRLRILVVSPPAGVVFAVQRGKAELLPAVSTTPGLIQFDLTLRVGGTLPDGSPNYLGEFAQGTPTDRFVYLNSGTLAGEPGSGRTRRAKLKLAAIPPEMARAAIGNAGQVVQARVRGTMRDGGPICASVKPDAVGWQLVAG